MTSSGPVAFTENRYLEELHRKAKEDVTWQKHLERDKRDAHRERCEEQHRRDNEERRHHLIRSGHGGRNHVREYKKREIC